MVNFSKMYHFITVMFLAMYYQLNMSGAFTKCCFICPREWKKAITKNLTKYLFTFLYYKSKYYQFVVIRVSAGPYKIFNSLKYCVQFLNNFKWIYIFLQQCNSTSYAHWNVPVRFCDVVVLFFTLRQQMTLTCILYFSKSALCYCCVTLSDCTTDIKQILFFSNVFEAHCFMCKNEIILWESWVCVFFLCYDTVLKFYCQWS